MGVFYLFLAPTACKLSHMSIGFATSVGQAPNHAWFRGPFATPVANVVNQAFLRSSIGFAYARLRVLLFPQVIRLGKR
jgi:hypothetical protein